MTLIPKSTRLYVLIDSIPQKLVYNAELGLDDRFFPFYI